MSTDDATIEQQIQAKGKTAPRITAQDVESAIDSEHYFTAAEGVLGMLTSDGVEPNSFERANAAPAALRLLTFCTLVLRNGFTVTGESACVSPENFDAEIGRTVARQNAVRQVWPLLGYALCEKLATTPKNFKDRVIAEKAELDTKRASLENFVREGGVYLALPEDERGRLVDQYEHMTRYSAILAERIANFTA